MPWHSEKKHSKKVKPTVKINPDGYVTAIVQIPCVDIDKHSPGKLQRLANETKMIFGATARVELPAGEVIPAKNT